MIYTKLNQACTAPVVAVPCCQCAGNQAKNNQESDGSDEIVRIFMDNDFPAAPPGYPSGIHNQSRVITFEFRNGKRYLLPFDTSLTSFLPTHNFMPPAVGVVRGDEPINPDDLPIVPV